MSLVDMLEKKYDNDFYLERAEDINVDGVVVLQDTFLKDVEFLDVKWEISGDYCVFDVVGKDQSGITLQCNEDMFLRGGNSPDKMRIKIRYSDKLLVTSPNLWLSRD